MIGFISGLLAVLVDLIPVVIIFSFIKAAAKKTGSAASKPGGNDPYAGTPFQHMTRTNPSDITIHKYEEYRKPDLSGYTLGDGPAGYGGKMSPGPANGLADTFMKDDRERDWLARQMKEEARIARRNSLDLGAAHDESCDALELKKEHERTHGLL